eukprot:SAG31_NODE_36656_length_311_cov_0.971698_1_plen_92_part_01
MHQWSLKSVFQSLCFESTRTGADHSQAMFVDVEHLAVNASNGSKTCSGEQNGENWPKAYTAAYNYSISTIVWYQGVVHNLLLPNPPWSACSI